MSSVNKVILVGRLGQDPELRQTASGQQVCTLNLATGETRMVDGQKQDKTEWHRIVLWDKQADLAGRYLKKGRLVYIEGKLQTRSWQDQQGQKRYTTEIVGSNMQFLEPASGSSRESEQTTQEQPKFSPSFSASVDDEIPF